MVEFRHGGFAFPRPYGTDEHSSPCNANFAQEGMTKREYIATEVLAALISYEGEMAAGFEGSHVQTANRYADVMIAESKKP